jgi:pimeloyl-ACP methyl ester carboxylesterase
VHIAFYIVINIDLTGPRLVRRARRDIVRKFSGFIDEAESIIPHYIYHCNAQNPSGERAFHAMMDSFGWAKFPMINRISALKEDVPLTFIYGARSWVDQVKGQQLKDMRKDVSLFVIEGAGHHVNADNYHEFNRLVLQQCENAESFRLNSAS